MTGKRRVLVLYNPLLTAVLLLLLGAGGCGALTTVRTVFPDHFLDARGDPLYIEDLLAVLQDADLLDDEKADALRALGLENEEVINAVIADGLDASPANTDGIVAADGGG